MALAHRRHPASLISVSLHDPQLLYLVSSRVNFDMVAYVARQTEKVFRIDPQKDNSPQAISLENFIMRLVNETHMQVPTLLSTLVYLERLRIKHRPLVKALWCTEHRVFLATLIVAAKYLNDASPKNRHWAQYARIFPIEEINLMEKQLLYLLDYDLRFDEADVCALFAPFMLSKEDASTRALAVHKVTKACRARSQAQHTEAQVLPSPATTLCSQSRTASLGVRGIVKRLSTTQVQVVNGNDCSLGMRSTLSNASTSSSTSSSDIASLLDDTSSSPPSSRWNSDGSDCSEDENGCPRPMEEDADTTITVMSQHALSLSKAAVSKKYPFKLRPIAPACAYKNVQFTQERTRKVSDTSSIRTVMASPSMSSPPSSSSSSFLFPLRGTATTQRLFHRESKRAPSASITPDVSRKDPSGIPQSSTMPSIPRSTSVNVTSSTTGGFLSRMWGAATVGRAQSGLEQNAADQAHSVPRTLKRLVLVHSRSSVFNRANTAPASRAVEV